MSRSWWPTKPQLLLPGRASAGGPVARGAARFLGRWGTPFLVGALYTAHEMSNPEYRYEGMNFPIVFVGVAITTAVYL